MLFVILVLAAILLAGAGMFVAERSRVRRRRTLHDRALAYHQKQREEWDRAIEREL